MGLCGFPLLTVRTPIVATGGTVCKLFSQLEGEELLTRQQGVTALFPPMVQVSAVKVARNPRLPHLSAHPALSENVTAPSNETPKNQVWRWRIFEVALVWWVFEVMRALDHSQWAFDLGMPCTP